MDFALIRKINESSKQPKLPKSLEEKLQRFKSERRVILFDTDKIDDEEIYGFCKKNKFFGKDPSKVNGIISSFIVNKFFDYVNESGVKSERISFEPDFSKMVGFLQFRAVNQGESVFVTKKESENDLSTYCELNSITRLETTIPEFITSHLGMMKNWHLRFGGSSRKKIKNDATPNELPHQDIEFAERIANDPLVRERQALMTLFPGRNYYSVLLISPRDLFEINYQKCSPLVHALKTNKESYLLVHSLKKQEIDNLGNRLLERYENENPQKKTVHPFDLDYISVHEFITKRKKHSDAKQCLVNLMDNAERQVHRYVSNARGKTVFDTNRAFYRAIIRGFCRKRRYDKRMNHFIYENCLNHADSIVKQINNITPYSKEREKLYETVLKVPDFSYLNPSEVMSLNIFPYNFPHIYLKGLKEHIYNSEIKTPSDLLKSVEAFNKEMEISMSQRDITNQYKRMPGSFEAGKRR